MNKKTIFSIISLALILTLGYARAGLAASTVTVSSPGNGVFVLQGAMENVAAMDITLTYDTASLSNPRVANGGLISGALTAVNLNVPGSVRMAIIRTTPMNGNGVIATLTFDRRGSSSGKITALSARLSNTDGRPLPSQVAVNNPPDTGTPGPEQRAQEEQRQDATASSAGTQPIPTPGSNIGVVVVPRAEDVASDGTTTTEQAAPQEQAAEPAKEPVDLARKTDGETALSPGAHEMSIHKHKSVLERFQEYTGARTAKAYISLFELDGAIGFHQEPPIILADGKSSVKVVFISDPGKKDASDVALSGAKLISIKQDPDYTNTWIAEVRPEKDAYKAGMTVSLQKLTIVFPLAVAPVRDVDLDKSGKVTEADFILFLQKRGTQKAPEFDLNNDGKRDYLDEYIFTANYLAAGGGRKAPPAGK
jgi:hypothetical protein